MKQLKVFFVNLLVIIISILATLIIGEIIFRKIIFGKNPSYDKFRISGDYTREWEDDYWVLARRWGFKSDLRVHPKLGWSFKFSPNSFFHPDIEYLKGKRAVLLFGDSFAACIDSTHDYCFEDYLNQDSLFNKKNYLLNYGINGYGVDQIYTVMKNTIDRYEDPVILFTFMSKDLDRSVLTLREGQKPVYRLDKNNNLYLDSSKISPTVASYMDKHSFGFYSFLWRKFLYSNLNFLPETATQFLTSESEARAKIIRINEAILNDATLRVKKGGKNYIFIVFNDKDDVLNDDHKNWRMNFVSKFFNDRNIVCFQTRELIANEIGRDTSAINKYFIPGDGHPTPLYNKLISEKIKYLIANSHNKNYVRDSSIKTYVEQIDSTIAEIKTNPTEMANVASLAKEKKITFDEMLFKDAVYYYWSKFDK